MNVHTLSANPRSRPVTTKIWVVITFSLRSDEENSSGERYCEESEARVRGEVTAFACALSHEGYPVEFQVKRKRTFPNTVPVLYAQYWRSSWFQSMILDE